MGMTFLRLAMVGLVVLGTSSRVAWAHRTELVAVQARLTVTGAPPAGSTFFAIVSDPASGNRIGLQLTDADGDGVYSADADAFEPDQTVAVRLERGTGTVPNPVFGDASRLPGPPTRTIREFGQQVLHGDTLFTASTAFGGVSSASRAAVAPATDAYLSMAAIGTVLLTAGLYALHRHRRGVGAAS